MAFKSKYKGAEIEEKLDKIEGIPSLISEMLTSRDYVTNSDLICILKNYAPSDYSTIPIDNVTIYWDRGILKSRGSGTGNGLWELRENSLGERFLYSTLPVVTKFGITTYSDEDASDIMSDLWLNIPIDNDTIYWYTNEDGTMVLKSKGGNGGNSSELLELLSKLFKGHFDNDGKLLFIEAMADIAVNGGMTLYYDNGAGDLPTIYDGLPIDGTTITWKTIVENGESKNVIVANINEDQLQDYLDKYGYVKGDINGNIDLSDYATLKYVKENYVSNNYLSEELKKYVTLSGNQDITGIKNFINGLQIGGLSIYKSKENVIYIDSDVVIKGGLTTYSDDSEDSSSILDALPIASTSSAGIAYFDSEFFTIDNTGKVSLKYTDSGGLDENQLKIYLTNNKYVTQDWVLKQDYASSNSVKLIQEELNIFLKGADTDDIINKWKELEVFLSGLSETDNLATILSNKADKEDVLDFIPNSGYTEITGEKNFVGGLKVNNGSISYNEEGYWTLEGSLLVTGGITMYGAENGYISANIMDAILTDGTTIRVNPETKQLEVIGGGTSIPINIYDGLDSPSTSTALSANQGRVLKELIDNIELGDIDLSGYLPTTGGTLNGGLKINGGLELSMTTPYIDFHYNGSTSDFTSRIIEASSGELTFNCKGVFGGLLKAANGLQIWHPASNKYCDVWHSGNFNPANYLPLSGGIIKGSDIPLEIKSSQYGFVGLNLFANETFSLHLGYWDKLGGVRFENLRNQSKSGIGVLDNGLVVQYSYDDSYSFTKNKIWHAGNFNPSNYLPLTGGTISGTEALPITISNNVNDGEFQVGIRLLNPNKTNTNGNTNGSAQFGYSKSNGVYMFNYDNYNYYNCAIGITDDGIAYVGKGGSISEKYEILHKGNYSSYVLPLSGGTLTGSLIMDSTKGYYEALPGGAILGYSNDGTKISGAISTGSNFVGSPTYPTVIRSNGTLKHYRNDLVYSYDILDSYNTDYMGNFDIDASALSTSYFYPVIFNQNQKSLVVRMYSIGGSASIAYNRNDLEFTFRGMGWNDVPHNLTVHHYNCYTASETTIGCIGMGQEGGAKVVWVRGGIKYKIYSNQKPYLKTANYTDGNQIFTVGVNFSGGTNTKVTTHWIPQTTSGLGTMYHSSGLAVGAGLSVQSNASIKGTLTNTGLATFSGGLTTTTGTFNRIIAGSVSWRNNLGAQISKVGWYRFAVSTIANNSAGNVIFTIRREYFNTDNESYTLMGNIDFGGCNWTQLGGSYRTQLITKVRCTYDNNGSMYFDFYYNGTAQNGVYVNCIGDAYCQTPTLVTSALGATNELALTNGYKIGTKTAYALTLYRTATDAGSFIMYGANNQLTKTWAVGADSKLRFGWYYKDTSAGTDVEKMWLDSNAELCFATGINGRKMKIPSSSGAITYYATNNGAAWNMGNFFNNNADSAVIGGIAAYGEGDTFKYYWMGTAHNDTNTIKFYNTGNVSSSCWGINNVSTNPNYELIHNEVHWYLQGYNGYLYLGAGYTKSFRIDSSGNCLSVGGITMYSDQRKKTILNHVELSLKQIADAPLIEHYYNSDESKTTHVGSIAQYWASLNNWFCKEDNEGFYTMEIQNAALASAISIARELVKFESKTDRRIRILERENKELKREVKKLKKLWQ